MIFSKFIRVCKRYKFSFVLSTYGELSLILRPNNTFENIKIEEEYFDLRKILLMGIKAMKEYRRGY